MYYSIKGFFETVRRFFYYGWKLRNSVDYDANTVWDMLAIKYRRIYNCMLKDSHLEWNSCASKQGMRKLLTMVVLCERLAEDEVYDISYDCMPEHLYEKLGNGTTRVTSLWQPNQRLKFLAEQKRSAKMKQGEIDLFSKLLCKNNSSFWD